MKKFEFIYFGQLLIASSEYIFLCLTFCLVKLPPTLRNIDWHYTTSICLPVQADQYFKLDEAGQAIVQNH